MMIKRSDTVERFLKAFYQRAAHKLACDLRQLPLTERKAQLKKILDGHEIQFSESFAIDGQEMFKHASKTGLEGVVSKTVRISRADRAIGSK